jgi:hypothetical protein
VTLEQLRRLGYTVDKVRVCVSRGDFVRVQRGLFRLRGARVDWHQSLMAGVLLGGDNAHASHSSAARLWGFPGFSDAGVEITVPLDRVVRRRELRAHRSGTLRDADLREVDGIPTLSAARTVADLSMRLEPAALGRLADEGLRRGVLTLAGLDRVVRHLSRKAPGRSPNRLAAVLAERLPGYHPGGSDLETWVSDCLVVAGLPAPVRQFKVVVDGRVYFLDLAYPDVKLDIEVDGFDFHRTRTVFDADRVRQNDLVRVDWTVLRFTSRSAPEEIVSAVRPFLFVR